MFPFHLIPVSTTAYSFFVENANGSPNGVLFMLGLLLFLIGSALRRRLPSVEDTLATGLSVPRADSLPPQTYIGTVADVGSAATSQRHANAA